MHAGKFHYMGLRTLSPNGGCPELHLLPSTTNDSTISPRCIITWMTGLWSSYLQPSLSMDSVFVVVTIGTPLWSGDDSKNIFNSCSRRQEVYTVIPMAAGAI